MSVQVRRRREAASFLSTYVGAQGELLVDTTNNRVQVHDGATPGGWPAAKLSEVPSSARTEVANANYTAQPGDRTIAYTALGAARKVTLPAASAFPTGTALRVFDETGNCSSTTTITLARAGTDTINGATSAIIAAPFGLLEVQGNGVGKWTITDQGGGAGTLNANTATGYPTSSSDLTQGYAIGSRWLVNATGEMFFCRDATAGAAVWNRADSADFFGYVAGRWYIPYGVSSAASGTPPGAGTMRLFPWVNKQRATLAAIGLRVTTVSAGGNAQAALYAAAPGTKSPTGTPLVMTPSMSTATAAAVNVAVSVQIDPGLYWYATNCDNGTAAFASLSNGSLATQQILGAASEAGVVGITSGSLSFQYSQTFGIWPDMTGVTLTEMVSNAIIAPLVHFSIGSVP